MEDFITIEVVEHAWAATSALLTAFGASAWMGRRYWVARKAATLALFVVQIVGKNFVDRWKAESVDGKLTLEQGVFAKDKAVQMLEAKAAETSSAVYNKVIADTAEVLVEEAVEENKKNKAKHKAVKISELNHRRGH